MTTVPPMIDLLFLSAAKSREAGKSKNPYLDGRLAQRGKEEKTETQKERGE
jgi:hypothetical protein